MRATRTHPHEQECPCEREHRRESTHDFHAQTSLSLACRPCEHQRRDGDGPAMGGRAYCEHARRACGPQGRAARRRPGTRYLPGTRRGLAGEPCRPAALRDLTWRPPAARRSPLCCQRPTDGSFGKLSARELAPSVETGWRYCSSATISTALGSNETLGVEPAKRRSINEWCGANLGVAASHNYLPTVPCAVFFGKQSADRCTERSANWFEAPDDSPRPSCLTLRKSSSALESVA